MSTNNTEQLTLYALPKIYNGSRYKYYQGIRSDNISYDTYLDNESYYTYSTTVYYKSLSEPITLHKELRDCDSFTYGKLTVGSDVGYKTYYIFIDGIITDQNGMTTINFSVDWWSSKWNHINCTKAHILRKSEKPTYMAQPYTPLYANFVAGDEIGNTGCILFSYNDSTADDLMKYGVVDFEEIGGGEVIETGDWENRLGVLSTDINDVFILPCFVASDFASLGWSEKSSNAKWYSSDDTGSSLTPTRVVNFPRSITTTESRVEGIMDWNGNSIWECPYGVVIDKFTLSLSLSTTHCQIRFKFNDDYGNEIIGKGFTYECRHASLLINQSSEYTWRLRDYDMDMRRIQSEKQLWTVASDMAQGAGFGFAFGGVPGTVAATIGGALNTVSTWAMNSYFDPQIQKATDLKYQRMQDEMSVIGDSITPIYRLQTYTSIVYLVDGMSGESTSVNEFKTQFTRCYGNITPPDGSIARFYKRDWLRSEVGDSRGDRDYYECSGQEIKCYMFEYYNNDWHFSSSSPNYTYMLTSWQPRKTEELTNDELVDLYKEHYSITTIPKYSLMYVFYTRTYTSQLNKICVYMYLDGSFRALNVSDLSMDNYEENSDYKRYIDGADVLPLMSTYSLAMDNGSLKRMMKDIEINGYYCDEITNDLSNEFGVNKVIQADNITVEGPCILDGKHQVVYRLKNGVEFI